jgi:hypothetical protein
VVHKATINTLKEGQITGGKVILLKNRKIFQNSEENKFELWKSSCITT